MEIFLSLLFLILGFILIIVGGDIFVECLIKIAKKMKISPLIIGATIASIATTLPEIIVGIISACQSSTELAVGNAIGSMIANIAFVCGLSIAFLPAPTKDRDAFRAILILICTALVFVFGTNGTLNWIEGAILLALFVVYMLGNVLIAKKQNNIDFETEEESGGKFKTLISKTIEKTWGLILLTILTAGAIGGGAYLLVEGATGLASIVGIPESVIGLTVVALGTSLPELVTAINSIKKKVPSLALGNLVGASIINITLIVGLVSVICNKTEVPFLRTDLYISLPILFLCILILYLPVVICKKTQRWQGICLLIIYILYISYLVTTTIIGFSL